MGGDERMWEEEDERMWEGDGGKGEDELFGITQLMTEPSFQEWKIIELTIKWQ